MGDKEKAAVMLHKYLAILPENIHIPPHERRNPQTSRYSGFPLPIFFEF